MKKNISINIGGIIFHIEEDGYDKLKNYLGSVNIYFSSFEDSKEIIEDIEGRIAEIFLSKLDEGKQVITPEDVNDLIATMGTTKDFDASIENEPEKKTEGKEGEPIEEKDSKQEIPKSETKKVKRFYRDIKRKVLGGVASGIANYFGINPIWVRLVMLVFLFSISYWSLNGFILLTYIILWIAVPGNDSLDEDKTIKKLFRNTDNRVLGGVAEGIASYFGIDPVIIRVLFIILIFVGGAGILIYLILWIILPEARSITEKMQMQGEPVTISNIGESIKKSLNVKEGEENVLVKILLSPFRLIAIVFKALGKMFGPILKVAVEILRIGVGIFLTFLGFALMIAFTISLAFLMGVGGVLESWVDFGDFPITEIFNSVNAIMVVSSYVVLMVPALAIVLLGLVVVIKRKVISAVVVRGLFGLWLIGIIGVAFTIPRTIINYSVESTYKEEQTFAMNDGITHLRLNELLWDGYKTVDLKIRGHKDSAKYLLELAFNARGSSRANARENGEEVDYLVRQDGNTFYFDSQITFVDAPFRFQDVSATFYIPYGKVFTMDYDLKEILRKTLWVHEYDVGDLDSNEWVFDNKGLKCLTCSNSRIRPLRDNSK